MKIFQHYFPELSHKLRVVPAGRTPIEAKKRDRGDPIFVCVASSYLKKAVDIVVDAWERTETQGARLIVVCPDAPAAHVDKARRLGIEWIVSRPPINDSRISGLYQDSDVIIIPQHTDGLNAYAEAIQYGRPIITMRSQHSEFYTSLGAGLECDVPFYFYDTDGYGLRWKTWQEFFDLVRLSKLEGAFDNTIQQMSEGITRLLDPNVRRSMADCSAQMAERLSIASRNEILRRVYTEAACGVD